MLHKIKIFFWRYRTYFRIVGKMVPWDYSSILEMMKFQVKLLRDYSGDRDRFESTKGDVKDMTRVIKLLENQIKSDYADRCGYDSNWEFVWKKLTDGNFGITGNTLSKDQKKNNDIALRDALLLEEKEWEELMNLLSRMRGWWD